jgi:hypothetical protein
MIEIQIFARTAGGQREALSPIQDGHRLVYKLQSGKRYDLWLANKGTATVIVKLEADGVALRPVDPETAIAAGVFNATTDGWVLSPGQSALVRSGTRHDGHQHTVTAQVFGGDGSQHELEWQIE